MSQDEHNNASVREEPTRHGIIHGVRNPQKSDPEGCDDLHPMRGQNAPMALRDMVYCSRKGTEIRGERRFCKTHAAVYDRQKADEEALSRGEGLQWDVTVTITVRLPAVAREAYGAERAAREQIQPLLADLPEGAYIHDARARRRR